MLPRLFYQCTIFHATISNRLPFAAAKKQTQQQQNNPPGQPSFPYTPPSLPPPQTITYFRQPTADHQTKQGHDQLIFLAQTIVRVAADLAKFFVPIPVWTTKHGGKLWGKHKRRQFSFDPKFRFEIACAQTKQQQRSQRKEEKEKRSQKTGSSRHHQQPPPTTTLATYPRNDQNQCETTVRLLST